MHISRVLFKCIRFITKDTIEETLASDAHILEKGILSDGKLIYSSVCILLKIIFCQLMNCPEAVDI